MAMKTSLQVKTTNPLTNKAKTKTATYANPNATNATLNQFAQSYYGGLSANSVESVIRVDKQDITNAEPPLLSITFNGDGFAAWNSEAMAANLVEYSAESDFGTTFLQEILNDESPTWSLVSLDNLYVEDDQIYYSYTRRSTSDNSVVTDTGRVDPTRIARVWDVNVNYLGNDGDEEEPDWGEQTTERRYKKTEIQITNKTDFVADIKTGRLFKYIALGINQAVDEIFEKVDSDYGEGNYKKLFNVTYDEASNSMTLTAVDDSVDYVYLSFKPSYLWKRTFSQMYSGTLPAGVTLTNDDPELLVFEARK